MTTLIRTQTPITAPAAARYAPFLHRDVTHRWTAASLPAVNGAAVTEVPDTTGNGWTLRLRDTAQATPWTVDATDPAQRAVKTAGLTFATNLVPNVPVSPPVPAVTVWAVVKSSSANQRLVIHGGRFLQITSGGVWGIQGGAGWSNATANVLGVPTFAVAVLDGTNSRLYTPTETVGAGTVTNPTSQGDISVGGHNTGAVSWMDIGIIPRAITAAEAADIIARIRAAYPSMPR